jgi:hypothetical protein
MPACSRKLDFAKKCLPSVGNGVERILFRKDLYNVPVAHEPSALPPSFGLRQPSGAFGVAPGAKAAEDCRTPRRYRALRLFMKTIIIKLVRQYQQRVPRRLREACRFDAILHKVGVEVTRL